MESHWLVNIYRFQVYNSNHLYIVLWSNFSAFDPPSPLKCKLFSCLFHNLIVSHLRITCERYVSTTCTVHILEIAPCNSQAQWIQGWEQATLQHTLFLSFPQNPRLLELKITLEVQQNKKATKRTGGDICKQHL